MLRRLMNRWNKVGETNQKEPDITAQGDCRTIADYLPLAKINEKSHREKKPRKGNVSILQL